MIRINLGLALLLLSFFGFSQTEVIEMQNINSKDGLCNNHVNAISEDDKGYIWIGTQNGLEVYNGNTLETLRSDPKNNQTISSNDISLLYTSKNNEMYAGTWGKGLNLINTYNKTIKRLPLHKNKSKNFIKTIFEDSDETLWIGSFGGGLYSYNKSTGKYKNIGLETEDSLKIKFDFIQGITEINGKIWAISWKDGLAYIDKNDHTLHQANYLSGNTIPTKNFSYVLSHNNQLILSTTWGEVYTYTPENKHYQLLASFKESEEHRNRITSMCFNSKGELWVSTESGLFSLNMRTLTKTAINAGVNNKKHNHNLCSIKDSRGVLWFGTAGEGLNHYDSRFQKLSKINLSETRPISVNAIYPLSSNLIMLGTNKGINIYDHVNKATSQLICKGGQAKNVAENEINSIQSFGNEFLIGTTNGLFKMSKSFDCDLLEVKDEESFKASCINDMTKIGDETWISSQDNGILILNDKKPQFSLHYSTRINTEANLEYDESYCIFPYSEEEILIGAQQGIEVFNKVKKQFEILKIGTKNTSDLMSKAKTIVRDNKGNIWIGSNEGLWKANSKLTQIEKVDPNSRFANQAVQNITIINNTLWVTSIAGMYSLDTETNTKDYYTTKHGLISNSFPHGGTHLSGDSLIYFGNGNGVSILYLKNKVEASPEINVNIKSIFVNDDKSEKNILRKDISKSSRVVLKHDRNHIKAKISILDFSIYNDDKYAFKLEGHDRDWRYRDYNQNEIEYTNLPPGNYTLKLKAVDKHLLDRGRETTYQIKINHPFWARWWFRALVVLIAGFIVAYLWKLRIKKVMADKRRLRQMVNERTQQLDLEKEKIKGANLYLTMALKELKEKQHLITSNIDYASSIQESLLPTLNNLKESFSDCFILYEPRDTVSGDFYWHSKTENESILIVADCTGHGVSGAFMSVYTRTLIDLIIKEKKITETDQILNELHNEMLTSFSNEKQKINDTLDITVLKYIHNAQEIHLSGAMSKASIINQASVETFNGDRFPIGGSKEVYKKRKNYKKEIYKVDNTTQVYLYTDGFQDQFHHETDKKLTRKAIIKTLKQNQKLNMTSQGKVLKELLTEWKGNENQTDDIALIGIKF